MLFGVPCGNLSYGQVIKCSMLANVRASSGFIAGIQCPNARCTGDIRGVAGDKRVNSSIQAFERDAGWAICATRKHRTDVCPHPSPSTHLTLYFQVLEASIGVYRLHRDPSSLYRWRRRACLTHQVPCGHGRGDKKRAILGCMRLAAVRGSLLRHALFAPSYG